ncbi:MAG: hypothetical protein B7Z55_14215 [Planctomycetales bacterium 12-60-4]|nr:MAG: hypothetical protein B7Z55_14215 [Planctomycetales bacterium 12-60-4]
MSAWFILSGALIGLSLGLTGGGGSIIAVPLLIYGLAVEPREAVGVSLAAVGATAFFGFLQRLRRREVEVGTGLLFAATGAVGAPIGTWLNSLVPSGLLLIGFAVLMLVVSARMWRKAASQPAETRVVRATLDPIPADNSGPVCHRDPEGQLQLTSQCGFLLAGLGLITGILSGLFGVGGGFVIVPALVMFSGMGIHRAVATSLMVISLVSVSGVVSYLVAQRPLDMALTTWFAIGGIAGMLIGAFVAKRLSGPVLQKTFSVAIVAMAAFIIWKQLGGSFAL